MRFTSASCAATGDYQLSEIDRSGLHARHTRVCRWACSALCEVRALLLRWLLHTCSGVCSPSDTFGLRAFPHVTATPPLAPAARPDIPRRC
jgi:hypothetical protein